MLFSILKYYCTARITMPLPLAQKVILVKVVAVVIVIWIILHFFIVLY